MCGKKKIVIIVAYLGPRLEWLPLFLASCGMNPSVRWHIYSNSLATSPAPSNVSFFELSGATVLERLKRLGVDISRLDPARIGYKLNDYKPAFGEMFPESIEGFDLYGFSDVDVLYGDIVGHYSSRELENSVISTQSWGVSGHFALLRNAPWIRTAFRRVAGWQRVFGDPQPKRFDEDHFIKAFVGPRRFSLTQVLGDAFCPEGRRHRRALLLREEYTTPLIPYPWFDGQMDHPTVWYWYNGRIYNNRDGVRSFVYLHFMNFRNARYMSPIYGNRAPWGGLQSVLSHEPECYSGGARIDLSGIHPLCPEDLDHLRSTVGPKLDTTCCT